MQNLRRLLAGAIVVLAGALNVGPARATAGDVDPSFGLSGRITGAVLLLADGRMLREATGGYSRADSAGQTDTGFGVRGVQAWPANFAPNWAAEVRLADGGIVIGGLAGGAAALVRLDANGVLDGGLAGSGLLTLQPNLARSRVESLAVQSDGRLLALIGDYYAAYYFDTPVELRVRRFTASLVNDPTFGEQGVTLAVNYRTVSNDFPYVESYSNRIAVLKDDRIRVFDDYQQYANGPGVGVTLRFLFLEANGARAAQPDPDQRLDSRIREWRQVAVLPDRSVLIDGYTAENGGYYKLIRLLPTGSPDTSFADGGVLELSDGRGPATTTELSPDGRFVYFARENGVYTTLSRVGLQGSSSGRVDASFGSQGRVDIDTRLRLSAIQPATDGSVVLLGASEAFRVLSISTSSPGLVSLESDYAAISAAGDITVPVRRLAGSSGVASVDYSVAVEIVSGFDTPVAGRDFASQNGRLVWADGESGIKTITVRILPDYLLMPRAGGHSPVVVKLSNASGALWIEIPKLTFFDSFPTTPDVRPTSTSTPSGGGDGGGGALDVTVLGLLLAALLKKRPHAAMHEASDSTAES